MCGIAGFVNLRGDPVGQADASLTAMGGFVGSSRPGRQWPMGGAGESGRATATALQASRRFLPIAFIDGNTSLTGRKIHGLPVLS
jgi:hypothetical protein